MATGPCGSAGGGVMAQSPRVCEVLGQTAVWGSVCCVSLVHLVYKDMFLQKKKNAVSIRKNSFLGKIFFQFKE